MIMALVTCTRISGDSRIGQLRTTFPLIISLLFIFMYVTYNRQECFLTTKNIDMDRLED